LNNNVHISCIMSSSHIKEEIHPENSAASK